jgi:hypothetical protein
MSNTLFNVKNLDSLKRKELQTIAKKCGVRANAKNVEIIENLRRYDKENFGNKNVSVKKENVAVKKNVTVEAKKKISLSSSSSSDERIVNSKKLIEKDVPKKTSNSSMNVTIQKSSGKKFHNSFSSTDDSSGKKNVTQLKSKKTISSSSESEKSMSDKTKVTKGLVKKKVPKKTPITYDDETKVTKGSVQKKVPKKTSVSCHSDESMGDDKIENSKISETCSEEQMSNDEYDLKDFVSAEGDELYIVVERTISHIVFSFFR